MARPRLAVDIGGTFTDVAVERDGACHTGKVLTTPHDPVRGVLDGARLALSRAGLAPGDVGAVIHATTLATNALIERQYAQTPTCSACVSLCAYIMFLRISLCIVNSRGET